MFFTVSIACGLMTYSSYWLSKKIYTRWKLVFLSPLIVSPLILITLMALTKTPYSTYANGAKWLTDLLEPATVAFAVPMYKHFQLLKKNWVQIIASVSVGSAVAIISSALFALWIGLSHDFVDSLVPRSITTPIAMDVSKTIGGVPTLTAVFVIVTGITGAIIGPSIIWLLHLKNSSAKGLLLGMSAHGAGTAKAFEIEELAGTFSSLAMIVAAIITIILSFTIFPTLQSDLKF